MRMLFNYCVCVGRMDVTAVVDGIVRDEITLTESTFICNPVVHANITFNVLDNGIEFGEAI